MAGDTTAAIGVTVEPKFRAGILLGESARSGGITEGTELSDLNNGEGVPILVSIKGEPWSEPVSGKVSSTVSFQLTYVEYVDDTDTLTRTVTRNVTLPQSATQSNSSLWDLAEDLGNVNIGPAESDVTLSSEVDVSVHTDANGKQRLVFTAISSNVRSLGISDVNNLALLGFSSGQKSDQPDLIIEVAGNPHPVALDETITLKNVIEAIKMAAPVTVYINSANGLTIDAAGNPLTVAAATTPTGDIIPAAIVLGITGSSADGLIEGRSLAGDDLADRLFLVAGEANSSNLDLAVTMSAGIDVGAALGPVGLDIKSTPGNPFNFQIATGFRLVDPDLDGKADGWIRLTEIEKASPEQYLQLISPVGTLGGQFAPVLAVVG